MKSFQSYGFGRIKRHQLHSMYKKRTSRFGSVTNKEVEDLEKLKLQLDVKPEGAAEADVEATYSATLERFVKGVDELVNKAGDNVPEPEGERLQYIQTLTSLKTLAKRKNDIIQEGATIGNRDDEKQIDEIITGLMPKSADSGGFEGFSADTVNDDQEVAATAAGETEETKKIRKLVLGVIQDDDLVLSIFGEASFFPGEFRVLQNKSEWVQMLRTSSNRETLFGLLSNFVHLVSSDIAQTVGRTFSSTDDEAISEEDMYQVENFISWHLLNQIMNKVVLQINLAHFGSHIVKPGVIRPDTPILPRTVKVNDVANFRYYVMKVCLKVFMVLAISSVLFTYVHKSDSVQQADFIKSIPEDFVVQHEITFFEGAMHVPVVTFLTPDVAERYESSDPSHEHWTKLVEKASHLTIKVHKFITPHLTGEFMHYFSFEGEEWSGIGDDETYEDEDEEGLGEEY